MSRHTSISDINLLGTLASSDASVILMELLAPGMYYSLDRITIPHQVTMDLSYRPLVPASNIRTYYQNTKPFKRIAHTNNYGCYGNSSFSTIRWLVVKTKCRIRQSGLYAWWRHVCGGVALETYLIFEYENLIANSTTTTTTTTKS